MSRISVASAKAKGRELQKWVCEWVSRITNEPWGKDADIESRPMGQSGVDVRIHPRLLKIFPYSIECKRQEKWAVHEWIKQAQSNQLPDTHWLLVARSSRMAPVVIVDAEHFFSVLEKLNNDRPA